MKKLMVLVLMSLLTVSQASVVNWAATGIRTPANGLPTAANQMYVEFYYDSAGAVNGAQDTLFENVWGSAVTGTKLANFGFVDSITGGGQLNYGSSDKTGYAFMTQAEAETARDLGSYVGFASVYFKVYYKETGPASSLLYDRYGYSKLFTVDLRNITTAGNVNISTLNVSSGGNFQWAAVPEPATMTLFGLGGLALIIRRKMRKEA